MTRLLPLLALTLAACQTAEPQPEITPEVRALAAACLTEIGKEIDVEGAPENAALVLTQEEQDAYQACIARRVAEA